MSWEETKVAVVKRFTRPKSKKDVRLFLGMTGYYWKFIPQHASIMASLTDLTWKGSPTQVKWTQVCEVVFKKSKKLLCMAPVFRAPDFVKHLLLQTDTSNQVDEEGCDHPISFFSKKFLP